MKVRFIYALVLCAIAFGCSKSGELPANIPPFPYQSYLEVRDSVTDTPIIGEDGNGFAPISHHIRYPELPDSLKHNLMADSLLQFYNVGLAFNTMGYDVSTAERYMEQRPNGIPQAEALEEINLEGVKIVQLKNPLLNSAKNAAALIQQGIKPSDREDEDMERFYEVYHQFSDNFMSHYVDTVEIDFNSLVDDYQKVHEKALTDTLSFGAELIQRILKEKDFSKKAVLSRELFYALYNSSDYDNSQYVAILDEVLNENQYSPLLRELWLIWRFNLQLYVLGGHSNDSAMYNLLYNDMRNKIALLYIQQIVNNPDDKLAWKEFIQLSRDLNIVRNGPFLLGNNANMDAIDMLQELK